MLGWLAIISFGLVLVAAETRSSVRIVVRDSTSISVGLQTFLQAILKRHLSGS